MARAAVLARLTLVHLTVAARIRRLRGSGDRGSETSEKVLWIALLVSLVLAVYAIFESKIIGKVTGITL
ncbi:hypothetical protein [Micromonospora sp. WMMD1082]|uniref:hypothetical protein n=1 Tax=Micromonospora sp. WMMD1082 TaxID=3016104 RepID=UPI002416962F|nr:hypothetical protein [Micromonospora sp. WMMD1082]MDG4795011.1 hypothetical protein [Micromonospora sp. WMMD1082]